jgi:sugar O-acyltransferase (sialic acid O-acetyltransferase NeuD family)
MRELAIFGVGGHGREVLQTVVALNALSPTWRCIGFIVDANYQAPRSVHGLPVIVGVDGLRGRRELHVAVAVGHPFGRQKVVERLEAAGILKFATLVHPRAWIGERVRLGVGTIVFAGAMMTTDIELGSHVHINLAATISHDTRIGAFSILGPGVSVAGGVRIGARVSIGTRASIIPGIEVGDDCIIGAGSTVIRSIPAGATAVGVPSRIIALSKA